MVSKPTYEELEQRVKELEGKLVKCQQNEEALRESQYYLDRITSGMYEGLVVIDRNFLIKDVNDRFLKQYGGAREEIIGRTCYEVTHGVDKPCSSSEHPCPVNQVFSTGKPFRVEHVHVNERGEERIIQVYAFPLFGEGGNVAQAVEVHQDVTEQRRAEEALQKYVHHLDERVKELNCLYGISHLVERQGISFEEIFQGTADLIQPAWQYPEITCARIVLEDQEFRTKNFNETVWKLARNIIVHGERVGTLEVCYLEEKPESDEGPFLKEERSLINAIAARLGKIIERKRAEEAVLESEEKYRCMMEAMNDPVYICSPDYRIEYMNPAMVKRVGGDRTGEPCYKVIHGLDEKCPWCVHENIQRGDLSDTRVVSPKDGRYYHVSHSPVFHADDSISKMTIFRDVTDLTRAEDALREARDELERRVEERTAELAEINEQLKREIEERKRIEEALRKDRSSLAEAQRIAHLGNWDWNIVTNELQWSDEIYRIFGLTPQEFGATYEAFLNSVHPDDRQFVKKAVDEAQYKDKPYSIDHRIVLPDGTQRIVHEQAGITFDNDGKPIRMIGTVHDITERKRAEEALQKSEAELRRLSSQLLEVQEKERAKIARELHDSIGQSLAAIKFGAENALSQMSQAATEGGVDALQALVPVVQQASEEVRRIHTDLRPPLLDDLGIVSTISWFCREFGKLYSGIQIEKSFDIEEKVVPEPLKIVMFRVIQEALNNAAKYARAELVTVSLRETDGEIELVIEDNGQGFDVEDVRSVKGSREGFGLTSMKERAELSGGALSIRSTKGAGTTVRASWPV